MNVRSLVTIVGLGLVIFCGCSRNAERAVPDKGSLPVGSFRLVAQHLIAEDADFRVVLLTIHAEHPAFISVKGLSSPGVALPEPRGGELVQGQVVLAAARIVHDSEGLIKVLLRARSESGHAGGGTLYEVPPDIELVEFLRVTVAEGIYRRDEPLTIGHVQGNPVVLTVSKPAVVTADTLRTAK